MICLENTIDYRGEKKRDRYVIPVIMILSVVAAWFVYFPITDTDIWWHLAAAREMLAQKRFLYTDPFSYTLDKSEWIDLHWLYQLISFGIFRVAGTGGLVVIKCLAVSVVCILISTALPCRRYMVYASIVFALLIYKARYLVIVRPIIITMICIAAFIFLLERFYQERNRRYLVALIPLQIVWTNSQGLFSLGPVIVGSYLFGEIIQKIMQTITSKVSEKITLKKLLPIELTVIFICIVFSCLINPYGLNGFFFPLKLLQRINPSIANIYAHNISENIPLFDLTGNDTHYLYSVLLATIVALISFCINRRSLRWAHLLLLVLFFSISVMAVRNVILYFLVIPTIIGYNCCYACRHITNEKIQWIPSPRVCKVIEKFLGGALVAVLLLFVSLHATVVANYPKKSMRSPFRIPVDAVEYLKAHPVKGRVFNSIRYGGYLIWRMYPEKRVYIDGRLIIRSPRFFADYLALLDKPDTFPEVARRFGISHVLLPTAIFNLYMSLVKWLYASPDWDLVFADGGSVLFVESGMNTGEKLHFGKRDDVEQIKSRIAGKWRHDEYIRNEGLLYFNTLVKYLRE